MKNRIKQYPKNFYIKILNKLRRIHNRLFFDNYRKGYPIIMFNKRKKLKRDRKARKILLLTNRR